MKRRQITKEESLAAYELILRSDANETTAQAIELLETIFITVKGHWEPEAPEEGTAYGNVQKMDETDRDEVLAFPIHESLARFERHIDELMHELGPQLDKAGVLEEFQRGLILAFRIGHELFAFSEEALAQHLQAKRMRDLIEIARGGQKKSAESKVWWHCHLDNLLRGDPEASRSNAEQLSTKYVSAVNAHAGNKRPASAGSITKRIRDLRKLSW